MSKFPGIMSSGLFNMVLMLGASSATAQNDKPEELILNFQQRSGAKMRNDLFTPILKRQQPTFFIAV